MTFGVHAVEVFSVVHDFWFSCCGSLFSVDDIWGSYCGSMFSVIHEVWCPSCGSFFFPPED